jgi:2'-5' RNA ligase
MELVEVLVLARREPGFPLPRVSLENGRQLSLTAAGVIMPERDATEPAPELEFAADDATRVALDGIDYDRLGAVVAEKLMLAAATPPALDDLPAAADDDELCVDEDGELCGDHPVDGDLAFNPDQRRDSKGRWTKGGGASGVHGTDTPGEGAGGGGSPGPSDSEPAAARTSAQAIGDWADQMRAEYPDLKLDIAQGGNGYAVLSRIVLPKGERGKGTGSKIMQSLVDLADELGVPLALTPSADFGGSVSRLKKFYEGFGFVPNKGRNRDYETSESYIRPPKGRGVTAAAKEGGHTGAMVALRMTDADAERLAVDGGLPADEMHMTLAYLGESADIPQDAREKILRGMGRIAKKVGAPLDAEGFSVNAFNPGDANDRPTAIVMGINGAMLGSLQQGVCKTLGNCDGLNMPEQHEPWAAHTTLAYDGDLSKIEQYADRVGPLTFDRLRVAFGNDVTDIPLGEIIERDEVDQDERDADDAMYARSARAEQLAADLQAVADELRAEEAADLIERINAAAAAAAE